MGGQEVLPEPKVLLTPSPKLPGTDGRKMSKSYGNTILFSDPEPVVRQKLKTMVTDPARVRRTDPGDPDKCPVGDLHKLFSTPETMAKVYEGCRSAGIGCIECKGWAADALVKILAADSGAAGQLDGSAGNRDSEGGFAASRGAGRADHGGGARGDADQVEHSIGRLTRPKGEQGKRLRGRSRSKKARKAQDGKEVPWWRKVVDFARGGLERDSDLFRKNGKVEAGTESGTEVEVYKTASNADAGAVIKNDQAETAEASNAGTFASEAQNEAGAEIASVEMSAERG